MNKKDLLGEELKSLMDEETKDIHLSPMLIDKIMNSREKTWKDKLHTYLNKEIEIQLAPAIIGFAALVAITVVPKDILKNQKIRIINIGSSQVFIRNYKDVSRK